MRYFQVRKIHRQIVDGNDIDIDFTVAIGAVGVAVRHVGETPLDGTQTVEEEVKLVVSPRVCLVDCHQRTHIHKRIGAVEALGHAGVRLGDAYIAVVAAI